MKVIASFVLVLGLGISACSSAGSGSSTDVPASTGPSDCERVGAAVSAADTAMANAEAKFERERIEYEQNEAEREASDTFEFPPINDSYTVGFERLKEELARAWPKMQDPTIQELVRELSKGNDWEANGRALQSLCPNDF